VDGKLQPTEVMEVQFREKPHSVYLRWLEGAGKAERVLYVEGENNGKLLARPKGALARAVAGDVVEREVESAEARQPGHSPLNKFGIKKSTERILAALKAGKERGGLEAKYLGQVNLKEVGDRPCFKVRYSSEAPIERGATEITVYIDKENWLLAGAVLKGEDGKLISESFFGDVRLNPEFKPDQFQRSALIP
jgi:hypothetical protein